MNSAPCDACFFCRHGQQNLCENLLFNNGTYAEFIRIPARIVEKNTLLVPKGVALEHAALTEPLACVVRGLEESGAKAGDTLVVVGAGPIGLMFMHVAELAGVKVIAVVKREDQIATATRVAGGSCRGRGRGDSRADLRGSRCRRCDRCGGKSCCVGVGGRHGAEGGYG
jgi:L-iditol 2-dehydrogenase